MKLCTSAIIALTVAAFHPAAARGQAPVVSDVSPLAIGETFTIESRILGETRRINVYVPAMYVASSDARIPVLYMPDRGRTL